MKIPKNWKEMATTDLNRMVRDMRRYNDNRGVTEKARDYYRRHYIAPIEREIQERYDYGL